MVMKIPQADGRVVWIGTNKFRVDGIKGGAIKRLKGMVKQNKSLGNIKTLPGLIVKAEKMMRDEGYQRTQAWLLEHDFTPNFVREFLVYMPDQGRITTRGALDDVLAYEFFGVPQGTQPKPENFRPWVERVIQRDPALKKEFDQKNEKQQDTMTDQLTYKFSMAVKKNGLKRNYTIGEKDPYNPDKLWVYWQGRRREVERHTSTQPWRNKKLEQAARALGEQKLIDFVNRRGHKE